MITAARDGLIKMKLFHDDAIKLELGRLLLSPINWEQLEIRAMSRQLCCSVIKITNDLSSDE